MSADYGMTCGTYAVTAAEMREIEARAIHDIGIPSLLLMENAAVHAAAQALRLLGGDTGQCVLVVCGPGNNGGDGFATARQLHAQGVDAAVLFVGDISMVKGDAKLNLTIVQHLPIPFYTTSDNTNIPALLTSADLVVDALFGTGLSRPIAGREARVIENMNACGRPILALDTPSGVCADSGRVLGVAVQAHTTVTFGFPKIGLLCYPGAAYAGDVVTASIALPPGTWQDQEPGVTVLTARDAAARLPVRPSRTHKGSFGRVCLFAGAATMPGAAVLCATAAYKSGAGYVHACVLPEVAAVFHHAVPEAVTALLSGEDGFYGPNALDEAAEPLSRAGVVALGPGLGRTPSVTRFVLGILEKAAVPVVLDADGLMAASRDLAVFCRMHAPCVITPHPGEMSALTGLPVSVITDDLLGTARRFAREHGLVVLLKDARTVIAAPDGRAVINTTGCAAMAKAGSGDVLTGLIAALIAQGLDAFDAAAVGAYIHGRAGQMAAEAMTVYGVTAMDLARTLPQAMRLA